MKNETRGVVTGGVKVIQIVSSEWTKCYVINTYRINLFFILSMRNKVSEDINEITVLITYKPVQNNKKLDF